MAPDDSLSSQAQLRLLESRLSNLDVRMALVESDMASLKTERTEEGSQARSNNVPTRVALVENNIKGVYRLMWIILVAILAGLGTNLFFVFRLK